MSRVRFPRGEILEVSTTQAGCACVWLSCLVVVCSGTPAWGTASTGLEMALEANLTMDGSTPRPIETVQIGDKLEVLFGIRVRRGLASS